MTPGQVAGLAVLLTPLWIPALLLAVRGVPAPPRLFLAAGIALYAGAAAWVAGVWPGALLPLAALVGIGWVWMAWRARPGAGRRRGLPPGSLGVRSSLRALADYRFYEGETGRHGPVFKTSQYHRPVLCVVGLDRCQRFLREHAERLTSAPLPIDSYVEGGILRYMPPERHARYRRLLQSCLKPRVLAGREEFIERLAAAEFAGLAAEGARSRSGGVRPDAAIDRFVFRSLAGVFFGIPPEDPAVPELRRFYGVVDHRKLWRRRSRTRAGMAGLAALVLDRRGAPEGNGHAAGTSGAPSSFLHQALEGDPDLARDLVFVENLVYLFHIARCDLTGLCGWLVKMLGDHPAQGRRIREERGEGAGGAAGRFVDETLRLRQSEYLYRTTSAPIRFEGYSVPSGWLVRLCVRESHTSPQAFDRPLAFDPDRFQGGTPSSERYQPFGIYEHACLGIGITKTIGRILVECLAAGFDCEVTRDGPMELGLHHHRHWTPSGRLEMRFTPIGTSQSPSPSARPA